MNKLTIGLLGLLGLGVVACSTPRYASSTEYDDVYYSSEDVTEPVSSPTASTRPDNNTTRYNNAYSTSDPDRYRESVDNYSDAYYGDDDFYYSRRIRRFNQVNGGSWRYYDPFFTNDLYFVMGTPAWNSWYNNGWYNWNRPRFGAFNTFNDPFFNDPFMNGWNSYGTFSYYSNTYYNPWVGAYYGYDPFFNPGFNAWNRPFYGGFNTWGGGFGYNSYYCPPLTFANSGGWAGWNRYNNRVRNTVTRTTQVPNATGNTPRTRYEPNRPTMNNSRQVTKSTNSNRIDYFTPRQRTEINSNRNSTVNPRPTTTNRPANTRTNTNRNYNASPRTNTNSSRTNSNRNSARPSTNSSNRPSATPSNTRPQKNNSSNRNYKPSNSNRNYSPRSNSNSNRSYSPRSNSNSNRSYSPRSNSSSNRSYSPRSSSGSRSSGTRSSSSSRRRQ